MAAVGSLFLCSTSVGNFVGGASINQVAGMQTGENYESWQQFHSVSGRCSVAFPEAPEHMKQLLPIADYVDIIPAVCYCVNPANRTQMLINGNPEPYSTPDDIVGDIGGETEISYEPRCLEHHLVPK